MVRNLEKESKKIRNGNRFVEDVEGTGVFSRDPDRLFREYTNLRKKIYSTYAGAFRDDATRGELSSYIDEQFIKLVKEYNINSPVDFPGYIDKKLKLRVKETFVKNKFKEKGRETISSTDDGIEILLDSLAEREDVSDEMELLDFIFSGVDLTEEEKYVINTWLTVPLTNKQLYQNLVDNYNKKPREAEVLVKGLKEFVKIKLDEYNTL